MNIYRFFKKTVLLAAVLGLALCTVGGAAAQTVKEKVLMDSFFRSSFRALKKLDANAFLRWYANDSMMMRVLFQYQHLGRTEPDSQNYLGVMRASMLHGFAGFYLKADGAQFDWRDCELGSIKYEAQTFEGRAPWISQHAFNVFALITDRRHRRDYAVKVNCIVVSESLVLVSMPSAPMPAPKGLDAWMAEYRDRDPDEGEFLSVTITTDTVIEAIDTMAFSKTDAVTMAPSETSPPAEVYKGMLGMDKISFELNRSPGESIGLQYDANGTVVQMMVEQAQPGPVLLLMAQDKASLWKLEQDGRQLKGRCIYFEARPDEIIDLRRTD